jgi:RecJ-like exonuclease
MTAAAARTALSGRLRFGDPEQIAAANFLSQIERLKRTLSRAGAILCPSCDGKGALVDCTGLIDTHDDQCDGECGQIICGICDGSGAVDKDCEPIEEIAHFALSVSESDLHAELISWLRSRHNQPDEAVTQ